MTRKAIALLLTICLVMGLSAPVYAEDIPNDAEPPQTQEQPQPQEPQEETPLVVSTLDELQAAIDAAEDGDTIEISERIKLKNISLITDKAVILVPSDSSVGTPIEMGKDSQISGFTFLTNVGAILISNYEGGEISITNCSFVGNENYFCFLVNVSAGAVRISDCVFKDGKDITLNIAGSSTVTVERCNFKKNTTIMQGAGINNMGECYVIDSSFTNNTAGVGGGIYNAGTMEISGCSFSENKSTDSLGQDVVSVGTLTILDEASDTEGYYEETTGEKIVLPLTASADTAKLVYLTDEQAAEYFAPEVENEPEDEDTDNDTDEPTDPDTPPDEPEDGGKDDSPEQQPTQPPEDNNGSEDTPTQPEDPSDGDDSEGNVNTPVEPSEPPQEVDDSEDDYSPPVYIRPPHRPSIPVVPEPEDPVEPEPTPALVCGEAAIDVSRSIILLGYGDGLLHEADSLTRAQLATIICRLLDEESIAELSIDNGQHFTDVDPDMWCYESVQIIANAGIVYGVGGGSYDPNGTVTWAQVLTVLSRFVEPQEYDLQNIDYDGWALEAVQTAAALGWIEDSVDFSPDDIISRGALVQLVNGILENYRNISEE